MDYTVQYRWRVGPDDLDTVPREWDLFLSAYNESNRVRSAFNKVRAVRKVWLVQEEYAYTSAQIASIGSTVIDPGTTEEADWVNHVLGHVGFDPSLRVCVDITGFMRHTLLTMVYRLLESGVERCWFVYSDPGRYNSDERTQFSVKGIADVRQIAGYQGSHDVGRTDADWMVLGTGYDDAMMRAAASAKRHARRLDVFGLPSLQPSMYQENVLAAARVDELGDPRTNERVFAPANDPFATAQALHRAVDGRLEQGSISNLYLSPTGTKAQALGFALFYIAECIGSAASMLLPLPAQYGQETTTGHSRSWVYEVDTRVWR